ncbi:MAG: sulfurtransferase TusA family protein [Spirochaetota bacterium]
MAIKIMDLKGLRCPQPTLRMTIEIHSNLKKGDIIEVIADCPTFENDVKNWCQRMKKTLLWVKDEGNGIKRCQVHI